MRLWTLLAVLALLVPGCVTTSTATVSVTGHGAPLEVAFSEDDAPSASYYAAQGQAHPGVYSAFDLTVAWADQAGAQLDVGYFDGLGFYLAGIDGVPEDPSSAFWGLEVDGTASDVGMADLVVADGMEISWVLTPIESS